MGGLFGKKDPREKKEMKEPKFTPGDITQVGVCPHNKCKRRYNKILYRVNCPHCGDRL